MKLRNKKTGEIIESACIGVFKHKSSGDCERVDTEARSIEKVLEVWEDYKPAEPLIKDEKIRKAVRAWAEVLNIEGVSIEHRCAGELCEVHSVFCGLSMEFDGSIMSDIQDGDYTITELCGEEEE